MVRGKAGAAHFEMIIGFVFFIGTVGFLFLFLSPWESSSLPNSALSGLHISFIEEVETNLSTVFVDARDANFPPIPPQANTCFGMELPSDLFEYINTDSRSYVRRLSGDEILSSISGSSLDARLDEDVFRIAISPEFSDESLSNCHDVVDVELGSVIEMQVVSYTKLSMMKERYYSDYDGLKRDLKMADVFDFAIVFEDLPEMTMEPVAEVSSVVEVLAKEYVVKVLRSTGSISNERISIRVW